MSSASQTDDYFLGRNFASSCRLNLQHYLWKDGCGYNIHPQIPVRDTKEFSIADVGTGTGIWLIDISRQMHLARLDGFDISAGQYPPHEWLPSNISLTTWDVYEDIPEKLQGKYDIVHVRLFLAVVRKSDPGPILDRLRRMLKPGGYLQWSEHNMTTSSVESARHVQKTDDLQFFIDHAAGMTTSWPANLAKNFEKAGFEDVMTYRYPISPETRGYFTQVHLMVMEEISYAAMDNSDPKAGGCEQRRRILEAAKQLDEGAAIHFNLEVTVGRKVV